MGKSLIMCLVEIFNDVSHSEAFNEYVVKYMDRDDPAFKTSTRPTISDKVIVVEEAFYHREFTEPEPGNYRIDRVSRCVAIREPKRLFGNITLEKYLEVDVNFDTTNGNFDPAKFSLPTVVGGVPVRYTLPTTIFMG